MNIFTDFYSAQKIIGAKGAAVTVGNFDGCHLGHQQLFAAIQRFSTLNPNVTPLIVTFDPHPSDFVNPERLKTGKLQRPTGRFEMLLQFCPHVLVIPVNHDFLATSAQDFMGDLLHAKLRTQFIAVGENFQFGAKRQGHVQTLREFCAAHSIELEVVPPVSMGGAIVSSSRIRAMITEQGNISEASQLLGWTWGFWGQVETGDQRGRKMQVPTANLKIDGTVIPKNGVYAGFASIDDRQTLKPMVMNIGRRPTFSGKEFKIEVHFIDGAIFDIYGHNMWVEPRYFLREEQKFADMVDLKKQIEIDITKAKQLLRS
jgi:riboflavin kinase / FMN adenylyltransferase